MTDQTKLLDPMSILSEAAAAAAMPLILGVSPTSGSTTALTTVSNELTSTGSAVAGSTVTIYDGTTALGAATANSTGAWSFATKAPLSDGAHAFSATETVSGATSAHSAATDVTVEADIGSFSPLTDQWHAPISVDGSSYYVENANVNGNAPWAITEVDDHTLQFTVKPGDLWPDNDSSRSEIGGATTYAANSELNVSYQLTVQPGSADSNLDWLILGQVHADDNSPIVEALNSDYPVLAFHLTGANGNKGGDYLGIQGFYLPSGAKDPASVTSANNGFLYLSPTPIVRGSSYSIQMQGSFQDNANGFVDVWINGVQVVDYHGPIGYGSANYWKEGVYEGYTQTQPITVDYANTIVSSGSISSGPVTVANYLANQAALDAAGSAAISDTAANVDSAIDTINADTHVSAITLLGTPAELDLTVAQTLGDTHALSVITNSSYGVTVTDTGGNISAEFDALNSDARITSIIPAGGSQNLVLTVDQMLTDAHTISLLDPFTITVKDTAADLDALSTAQIAEFAADGVTELDATNADLSLALAQRQLLGSEGISALQPYSGGGTETITYHPGGGLSTILYQGVTGRSYTSVTITYGVNGKPASALYNTGVTETWTYNADRSYSVHYADVTGQAYTSYSVDYGTNGKPSSATYSNGTTVTWSYNTDGSLVVTTAGITGRSFTSEKVLYNSAGSLVATATNQSIGDKGFATLFANGLTISDAASSLSMTVGNDMFVLNPHTSETITANGFGSEVFNYGSGFGRQTISGFQAGGSSGDTLSLGLSMFNGLSSTNTAAQNAAILMSSNAMVQSGSAVLITDLTGDRITLDGETTTALVQSASGVFKFA